jgi:hypothetical protein
MTEFWAFFNNVSLNLLQRQTSFRYMFEYLDTISDPVIIVETGCVRNPNAVAMAGEGQSTLLFDKYVSIRNDGSRVYSVDINPDAVMICKSLVSNNVSVHEGDSVGFLYKLAKTLRNNDEFINLLYLDSYDVDYNYWFPSAAHHLKELTAAWSAIDNSTLVTVDDCPLNANLIVDANGQYAFDKFYKPIVGGKGRLVAEFAEQVGAQMSFSGYQHGWKGF